LPNPKNPLKQKETFKTTGHNIRVVDRCSCKSVLARGNRVLSYWTCNF